MSSYLFRSLVVLFSLALKLQCIMCVQVISCHLVFSLLTIFGHRKLNSCLGHPTLHPFEVNKMVIKLDWELNTEGPALD